MGSSYVDLFQYGDFTSHAGLPLKWKIECDAISPAEWDCLAHMVMEKQSLPFSRVEGIPRGGVPFANALKPFASGNEKDMPMIVDDIYTTGTSFNEYIDKKYPQALIGWGYKWVVFARTPPDKKRGIRALFTMEG